MGMMQGDNAGDNARGQAAVRGRGGARQCIEAGQGDDAKG